MADCTASGAALWVQLCALLKSSSQGVAGSQLRIDLTQDGGLVDGTVDLGELAVGDARPAAPFEVESGEVSIDGTLRLMLSTVTIAAQELELRAEVLSWETRADTPGRMTGQFQVELSVAGDSVLGEMTGALVIDGSLEEVMRSASAASAAPAAMSVASPAQGSWRRESDGGRETVRRPGTILSRTNVRSDKTLQRSVTS